MPTATLGYFIAVHDNSLNLTSKEFYERAY